MQGDGKKRLWTLPLLLGAGLMTSAVAEESAERSKEGFIEGSELNLLLRNYYFNRDFRKGQSSPVGGGYSEEWAQGFMANFSSGFTRGRPVGVGIDAFAQLGVRLDSGGGRSGAGGSIDLLPYDSQGRAQDDYSRAGGAVKLRWYGTVLRVGDVFPETPVVQFGNSRLFPSSFRGFTLVNDSLVDGLTLQAGKLDSMTQPNSTSARDDFYGFYGGRIDSPWVAYAGGDYQATEHWNLSLYSSRQKDAWDQYFAGTSFSYPLDENLSLLGGANYYKVKDEGKQVMGELNNNIWSVRGGFSYGPHQVLLSYQRNNGDNDFDYLRQTDSIYLDNSIQYSDFNSPKERSLMLRYDLDMAAFGVRG